MKTVPKPIARVDVPGKLETLFHSKGSDYKQLKRTGNIALYEVRLGNKSWFDVIIVRDEKYPTDMAYGVDAWSYRDVADAEVCMKNEVYLAETE